jgi:hypothetical protein
MDVDMVTRHADERLVRSVEGYKWEWREEGWK